MAHRFCVTTDVVCLLDSDLESVMGRPWRLAQQGLFRQVLDSTRTCVQIIRNELNRADGRRLGTRPQRRRSLTGRYRIWTGLPRGVPEFDPVTILEYGEAYFAIIQPLQPLEKFQTVGLGRVRQLLGIPGNMELALRGRMHDWMAQRVVRGANLRVARGQS